MWPLVAASPCGSGASGSCHCGWAPWLLGPADTGRAKGGHRGIGGLQGLPQRPGKGPLPGPPRAPPSSPPPARPGPRPMPRPGPCQRPARAQALRAGLRAAPGHSWARGTAPGKRMAADGAPQPRQRPDSPPATANGRPEKEVRAPSTPEVRRPMGSAVGTAQ